MEQPEIFLVYARAANGTIGMNGALPWHLPADMRHFKRLTMGADGKGRPMIMGRKTFESFGGPLPGRRHIIFTRNGDFEAEGAEVVRTVGDALELACENNPSGQIAVIGGAQIYGLFLPLASRIELTEIHSDYHGDTHMHELGGDWVEIAREDHPAEGGCPAYSFVTLIRERGGAA